MWYPHSASLKKAKNKGSQPTCSSSQSSEELRHVGGEHGVRDNANQEAHRKCQATKLDCKQLLWVKHHMKQNLPQNITFIRTSTMRATSIPSGQGPGLSGSTLLSDSLSSTSLFIHSYHYYLRTLPSSSYISSPHSLSLHPFLSPPYHRRGKMIDRELSLNLFSIMAP